MWEQQIIKFFNALAITKIAVGYGTGASCTNKDVVEVATKTNPHSFAR